MNTKSPEPKASDPDGDPARTNLVRHGEISRENLHKLIQVAEAGGYRLVDWERFGQPPLTDLFRAVFDGPAEHAGKFVEGVVGASGMRARIRDGFPNGIPKIDRVRFELEAKPDIGIG